MRRDFKGKRVLITGASGGIGRALAVAAGRRGAEVVLAARSEDRLADAAREVDQTGGKAVVVRADVTNPDDRRAMFQTALDHFGGLDVLINNAGVGAHGHFIDLGPEVLRQTMEVNFFAYAENCRLAIPILVQGRQPLIVNVASMAGRRGVPAWTEYSASKFAVCGFSEALRAELARFEIDLLLAVPGLTASGLGEHLLAKKGRLPLDYSSGLPPATVAEKILGAAERNAHEVRIERQARMLLFVNWLAPRYVDRRLARLVRKLYADELASLRSERLRRETAKP